MHPLRVGIVGFGEIAQYHLRYLVASGKNLKGAGPSVGGVWRRVGSTVVVF